MIFVKIIAVWLALSFLVGLVTWVIHDLGGYSVRDWPFVVNGWALASAVAAFSFAALVGLVVLLAARL